VAEQTWLCDRCGSTVGIGQFPICHGSPTDHGPWKGAEEPMAPEDDEMLTDAPGAMRFTTVGEKVRYMDRHSIVPRRPRDGNDIGRIARGSSGRALFFDMGGSKR
jgi:hypothetical protein